MNEHILWDNLALPLSGWLIVFTRKVHLKKVFNLHFSQVNSPTHPSTYSILFHVVKLSRRVFKWIDFRETCIWTPAEVNIDGLVPQIVESTSCLLSAHVSLLEMRRPDQEREVGTPLIHIREPETTKARESILNVWRRTVNWRRPDRARNDGSTGLKILDDTRFTPYALHSRGLRGGWSLRMRVLQLRVEGLGWGEIESEFALNLVGVQGYVTHDKTNPPRTLP